MASYVLDVLVERCVCEIIEFVELVRFELTVRDTLNTLNLLFARFN